MEQQVTQQPGAPPGAPQQEPAAAPAAEEQPKTRKKQRIPEGSQGPRKPIPNGVKIVALFFLAMPLFCVSLWVTVYRDGFPSIPWWASVIVMVLSLILAFSVVLTYEDGPKKPKVIKKKAEKKRKAPPLQPVQADETPVLSSK